MLFNNAREGCAFGICQSCSNTAGDSRVVQVLKVQCEHAAKLLYSNCSNLSYTHGPKERLKLSNAWAS